MGREAKSIIFNTITISDGISMGTEGMKYSLVSREVIADSIETVAGCEGFDGLVAIGGCDKNMPACLIAMARLNRPSVFVYGGTILPGCIGNRNIDIVSIFEAVGAHSNGKITDGELEEVESCAIPGPGSCGGMYTANTMASAIEALGMSLPNSSAQLASFKGKTGRCGFRRGSRRGTGQTRNSPIRYHDEGSFRERDDGSDRARWFDQRRFAPACHGECGRY